MMLSGICPQSQGKGLILQGWHAEKQWLGHRLP
jgi:hypothetical protein